MKRVGDLQVLALLALVKLVFHLATSQGYGIFRDEYYYLACSDRLAWGYVDHPPLSIALLWLVRRSLGDSLLAIRLLVAVAGAASVFVAGLIARELGGRRGAQVLTALTVFFAPYYLAVSHFYSMNAFDVLCWTVLELLAVRILWRGEPRLWVWFGVVAGIGLQNKYSVAFFAIGLMAGLLSTPQRRQLASGWLWLGGALAAALFAPHVIWEAANGWPSLEFIANAAAEKNAPVTFASFLGGQVVLLHPLALPLWLAGLLALLFAPELARVRALGIGYLATFALLLAQRGKVYYLAPYYPVLFAAGALMLERLAARPRLGWAMPAATALYAAAGIAVLPLALPMLPVETFLTYSHAIGIEEPRTERSPRGALPQLYADMHGWPEMVDTVERAAMRLPAEQRARAVVLVRNYGEAGAIEFLGRPRGLPRVITGHNNFWLWGPGDLRPDDTVIAVGLTREKLLTAFATVERVDTTHCQWCMPYENDLPVHIARGMTQPLYELWARLKRFS